MTRGTGRTTKQIAEAEPDSIFIWVNSQTQYPKSVAEKLGRNDIKFYGPSFFSLQKWRGLSRPVVIDHAAWGFFTNTDYEAYQYFAHNYRGQHD